MERVEAFDSKIESLHSNFEKLNELIDSEIKSAVRKGIKDLRNELIMKNSAANAIKMEDIEDIISTKVERSELVSLLDIKSNKVDTQTNMQAIDIIHKQIKHLTVLLIEILRKEAMKHIKTQEAEVTIK